MCNDEWTLVGGRSAVNADGGELARVDFDADERG